MTRDLIPNGGDIPVTNENRIAYVQAYVEYVLDVSVTEQFEAFQRGFRKVCDWYTCVLYIYVYYIHIYGIPTLSPLSFTPTHAYIS